MASISDEVIYQAPGLRIYIEHGCLIADFYKHTKPDDNDKQ